MHEANLCPGQASFKQRKQLINSAVYMNPVNPKSPGSFEGSPASLQDKEWELEPAKIIWILHNIKKSVYSIVYYGDLTYQGQANLRQENQQLIKSVYAFQKLYKEIVMAEHEKIVQQVIERNQRLNASERRDDEYMEMISEYSMEPTKSFN